ncbi:hypothetical protein E8E12_001060 [Didymella heteroderae]|uniref:Uncharacterized protein n=1 Tax=Didymella heteroderae TaxID=1769908 RepID=A0A9P5BVF9_9PLEO|nr:hypothetical protein E8E12_001060 [Didymella heteroderae]
MPPPDLGSCKERETLESIAIALRFKEDDVAKVKVHDILATINKPSVMEEARRDIGIEDVDGETIATFNVKSFPFESDDSPGDTPNDLEYVYEDRQVAGRGL